MTCVTQLTGEVTVSLCVQVSAPCKEGCGLFMSALRLGLDSDTY